MLLSQNVKLQRVKNAVAAGTTAINSDVVDTSGYEGVLFIVAFGTITATAVTSVKAQSGTDGTVTDAADLEGTSVNVADSESNKLVYLDIGRPAERYVRAVVSRGTANAVVDSITAVLYGPRVIPPTHDSATVSGGEAHAGPAEGTA